jgi:hypothetical protein
MEKPDRVVWLPWAILAFIVIYGIAGGILFYRG